MFETSKQVIASLPKCYAICLLESGGEQSFLVATEKAGECRRFDACGNYLETIWSEPGGVMTMVQVPGGNGAFLSTRRFFSPNDSAEASLVLAEPITSEGAPVRDLTEPHGWRVTTLCPLPFVHRFDIVSSGGRHYLIACTLKSGHNYKEDWTQPGKILVRELPSDFSRFDAEAGNALTFETLLDGLTKNHGYGRFVRDGQTVSLVASENGLYRVTPPTGEADWQVEKLLAKACSDVRALDIDGDGKVEYMLFSPFHGAELSFYREGDSGLEEIYRHEQPLPFLHALWGGELGGVPTFLAGYRQGERDLLAVTWDAAGETFAFQRLDHDRGPTNVQVYTAEGQEYIIAANRETDEVALYALH